jgi:hypothetical protein
MSAPDEPVSPAEDRIIRARVRRQQHQQDDDVVPKLPRGKGLRLSAGHLLKLGMTAGVLVMLVFMRRPCADNVANVVIDLDQPGSAARSMPRPGNVELPADSPDDEDFVLITPGMTEDEVKAAVERQRGAGSGRPPPPEP